MKQRRDNVPAETRTRALHMLLSGKITLPEMAALLDVSTQSVWNWCREARIDWKAARRNVVEEEWQRTSA